MCKSLLLLLDDDDTTFAFLAFAGSFWRWFKWRWWRWREDTVGLAKTWRGADMHARMDDVCKAFAM
jgi:hypothetical protein